MNPEDRRVFDVAFWKMHVGTDVNILKGSRKDRPTKHIGNGRIFTVHPDGTIGPLSHTNLVLGIGYPKLKLVP